jgi:sterol desaturase/sphingolipid hydroxylase (fatty acid hydroxylase superfamily)
MTIDALALATTVLGLAALERFRAARFQAAPLVRPYFLTDVFYLVTGTVALGLTFRAAALALRGALSPWLPATLPLGLAAPLAVVLYDLGAYASHLLLHRVDALWRLHKVHHSSRTLDWLATFRGHVLEHALRHVASAVFLVLFGFPAPAVAVAAAVYGAWATFVHANVRFELRVLEPLLVTPRLHRLHHAGGTSRANLGTLFSLWDRLGGRLVTDPQAPLEPLGVPGERDTYPQRWLPQLLAPFRR